MINKMTSMTTRKKINMCCCCVSRDIFGFKHEDKGWNIDINSNQTEKICQYINFSSPIVSNQNKNLDFLALDPSKIKEECTRKLSKISNFKFRCTTIDVSHTLFDFLTKVEADYLILDNGWARYNYLQLENGSIITDNNRELIDCLIELKYLPPIAKKIAFTDFDEKYLDERVYEFCNNLIKYYEEKKIILIEVKPAHFYLTKNKTIESFYDNEDEPKLDLAHKLFKKHLKNAHVISAPNIRIADQNHIWGLYPLHFVKELYTDYYYPLIKEIIDNGEIRDSAKNRIGERFQHIECLNYFKGFYDRLEISSIVQISEGVKTFHDTYLYFNLLNMKLENLKDASVKEFAKVSFVVYKMNNKWKVALTINVATEQYYINIWDDNLNCSLLKSIVGYDLEYSSVNSVSVKTQFGYLSARKDGKCALKHLNRQWEHFAIHF